MRERPLQQRHARDRRPGREGLRGRGDEPGAEAVPHQVHPQRGPGGADRGDEGLGASPTVPTVAERSFIA